MPTNFITLPRSELYERVWSKPVTEVAKEFGISDVALAKRCRALKIPLPPRGYWARVAAGQSPKRPRLPGFHDPRALLSQGAASQPERSHQPGGAASPSLPSYASASAGEEPVISFAPLPKPKPDAPPLSPAETALRARIDALDPAPRTDLTAAHPAVLRTAVHLKHLKSRDLTWPRGTRSGPIIEVRNISEAQQERALKVLDALLRGAESLGWPFESPPRAEPEPRRNAWTPPTRPTAVVGRLIVDGEPLQLRIDERQRQSDHVPTEQEKADKKRGRYVWMPRFDYAPSGELRLHVTEPGHSYTEKVWKDTKAHPLEVQVRKVLHGLLSLALERKRHREEQRCREIAARELERQQAMIDQRRAANAKLIAALEAQAGAWVRAQLLRRYLRAARRTLGTRTVTTNLQGKPIDFLAWAEHYVNQLDPLHPDSRDPDFTHHDSWQYNSEEKRFTEELQRLSGHAWERASKLVAEPTESDADLDDDEDEHDDD
jgi:hypothetical protein